MKLNPFAGLPNPREVWAWGMYDLANQSFTLLIITLLFSIYVTSVVVPQPALDPATARDVQAIEQGELSLDEAPQPVQRAYAQVQQAQRQGKLVWSLMHGGSLLVVVLASPLVGAWADVRAKRKALLMATGVLAGVLTCALGLVGPGMVLLAALLYVPANICYQLGENFLASFLPDVSTRRTMGRISALGWTMGYVGALLLLGIVAAVMLLAGLKEPSQWRGLFVFAGLWFLLGIIPAGLFLRADRVPAVPTRDPLAEAVRRVRSSLAGAGRFDELRRFLLAFFVYALGVQTIISFASIIARDFGFTDVDLVLFIAQLTITAAAASLATSTFQDRLGARATVALYLLVWVASCLGMVAIAVIWPHGGPQWPLWTVGNGLGFALGGIGTASRAMVGRLTPVHRSAEFFGLWGMVYKLAGAVGTISFGLVARYLGDLWSLVLLAGFFLVGLGLLLRVGERRGIRQARAAERAYLAELARVSPGPA
ncbi:MAG: MFS transporter [Phycisphaerales bacterium]|nr:MAG: MFS transporter [Phycisphaerales bacterium]